MIAISLKIKMLPPQKWILSLVPSGQMPGKGQKVVAGDTIKNKVIGETQLYIISICLNCQC
jgi:hypothetical protein